MREITWLPMSLNVESLADTFSCAMAYYKKPSLDKHRPVSIDLQLWTLGVPSVNSTQTHLKRY